VHGGKAPEEIGGDVAIRDGAVEPGAHRCHGPDIEREGFASFGEHGFLIAKDACESGLKPGGRFGHVPEEKRAMARKEQPGIPADAGEAGCRPIA
jgi:hypothetical protein